jgi:hypothetical protein
MRATLALALLSLACAPASAQPLGEREQWQPEVMAADPRLDQAVEVEILARAAVPALAILSEQTGVSLGVAPEDLNTVGERKVTLVSNGLALRAIMVQLCEAIQEAHWDVAEKDGRRVYRLHRKAGVEETMDWLTQRAQELRAEEKRGQRLARMELARRALQMSPEELAELEETDPLLARSVRDPHSRDLLEMLLALPPEQAAQLRDTGRLEIPFLQASERLREAIIRIADRWHPNPEPGRIVEGVEAEVARWREDPSHTFISFEDWDVEHGFGIFLNLNIPTTQGLQQGFNTGIRDVALFPRYCSLDDGETLYARLLMATGVPDKETAFEMVMQRDKEGFHAGHAAREERHNREWAEPTDPELLQTVVVGERKFGDFAEFHAFIAAETGLCVVSDYFTLRGPYVREEHREGIPLWRLLHLVGEHHHYGDDLYLWTKAGPCLVFHRADWPALARVEIPESIIADYRARLEAQGELTLDDLAELALALDGRGLPGQGLSRDLQRAAVGIRTGRWALLLYGTLTAEQKEQVASPAGLAFDHMTLAQQRAVRDRAENRPVALPAGAVANSAFRLSTVEQESHDHVFEITQLELHFDTFVDPVEVKFTRKETAGSEAE